jgi:hypothetical protein
MHNRPAAGPRETVNIGWQRGICYLLPAADPLVGSSASRLVLVCYPTFHSFHRPYEYGFSYAYKYR